MEQYQRDFIQLALEKEALGFGAFTLKSGRVSPYFFNAGKFQDGQSLACLGNYYASALMASGVDFDMMFGPAYKGIPLATSVAVALANSFERNTPVCFNRKEAKDHGEKGVLIGAPLEGKVVIVDDVITAGTAVREVMTILNDSGAVPAAVLIGLDRQERGQGKSSAIQEIEEQYGIPVVSIVKLEHIMSFLKEKGDSAELIKAIATYRSTYGIE